MPQLILVRHAKSSWDHEGLSDFERPLNDRGRRDAPAMGQRLQRFDLVPALVVSSPAMRAISTARLIAQELEIPLDHIQLREPIYDASVKALLAVAQGLPSASPVMLVGHNPGISEFAKLLAPCPFDEVPTCAVVVIDLDVKAWKDVKAKTGRVARYFFPKDGGGDGVP
ncbi:MAG TPA: histidine phosphatase family protein [Nevskiaceae bacterium]|nr:histidine phosphatase family protein [Nevskiaceae bacterium]